MSALPPSDDVHASGATPPEGINLVVDSASADTKVPPDQDSLPVPALPPIDDNSCSDIVSSSTDERHRQQFNRLAFSLDSTTQTVKAQPGRTSMTLTNAKWKEIIDTLLAWGPRDDAGKYIPLPEIKDVEERKRLTEYRQCRKHAYEWVKNYEVEAFLDPITREVSHRLRRIGKRGKNRIALPMDRVYGVIKEAHCEITSHCGRDATYSVVNANYYNITQEMVSTFISNCSVCIRKNMARKNLPGAKKPIHSSSFRDRFQVDLIDMRNNPQFDVFGVEMKWIVTCKDHFTGYTGFFPIPAKEARYVVYTLEQFFALIGYPKVFHTDNGTEFKAETGGVQVITEYGVICQGVQKKTFWIPSENYEVIVAANDLETHPLVTPELAEVRRQVLAGTLELDSRDKLTLQQDQKLYLGFNETPKKGRSKGCNCGKGKRVRQCTQKCSCIRRKVGCTSSCLCMGNCSENKHNK